MASDILFYFFSFASPATSIFLYFTVLLAGIGFLKKKSVGKMSLTFYCLANYSGCVWAFYGVLLQSMTVIVPNLWCVATTSFAIFAHLKTLKAESDMAAVAAAKAAGEGLSITVTPKATFPICDLKNVNNEGDEMTGQGTLVAKIKSVDGISVTTGVEIGASPSSSVSHSHDTCVSSKKTNMGANNPPISSTTSVTISEFPSSPTLKSSPASVLAATAEELSARNKSSRTTFMLIQAANLITFFIILIATYAAMRNASTSNSNGGNSAEGTQKDDEASSSPYAFGIKVAGIAGVLLSTIQFMGPLDQVSWIVKNKNSVPLDPKMTIVGTFNSFNWLMFGLVTADVFLAAPMVVSLILCAVQLGLIVKFPRKAVEES